MRYPNRLPDLLVTRGLVACYDFLQGSNPQILYDRGPYGLNGQLGSTAGADVNDPTWVPPGLSFGGDDYVSLPKNVALHPTTGLTVMAVASKTSWAVVPEEQRIVSCTQIGGWALGTKLDAVNRIVNIYANGAYRGPTYDASGLSDGAHVIAGMFDGRYVKTYADKVQAGSTLDLGATYPITYSVNNGALIGVEPDAAGAPVAYYWNGSIDYLLIYGVALTDAEYMRNYHYLRSELARRGVTLP
jgi:hypothetical protein